MCDLLDYPRDDGECECVPYGSVVVDQDDFAWLLVKAELALDLDAFCTTSADRERLARIRDRAS